MYELTLVMRHNDYLFINILHRYKKWTHNITDIGKIYLLYFKLPLICFDNFPFIFMNKDTKPHNIKDS